MRQRPILILKSGMKQWLNVTYGSYPQKGVEKKLTHSNYLDNFVIN